MKTYKSNNLNIPFNIIKKIIYNTLLSLEVLHTAGYIHTDIKPENYLLRGINKLQNDIYNDILKFNIMS